MIQPIKNGMKYITPESINKLKKILEDNSLDGEIKQSEVLPLIYYSSNDPLQRLLIEELCKIKGIQLEQSEEPQYA